MDAFLLTPSVSIYSLKDSTIWVFHGGEWMGYFVGQGSLQVVVWFIVCYGMPKAKKFSFRDEPDHPQWTTT